MNGLNIYLLTIIGASLICAIIKKIMQSASQNAALVRFVCGLVMGLTLLAPLKSVHLGNINGLIDAYSLDAEQYISQGQELSAHQFRDAVLSSYNDYVIREANKLGIKPEVEITLSSDQLPVPDIISLRADASPYSRTALTDTLAEAFGIEKERIKWN